MQNSMHLSINIIGDAFADIYCYLEGDMPSRGGDARLTQPIHKVPGGSGLNTATHLSSLFSNFGVNDTSNINLQTAINENDEYGKLLSNHCQKHNIRLINRRVSDIPACFFGTNESMQSNNEATSTGHCAVIVSKGERSFMTHLGTINDFEGEHILTNFQDLDSKSNTNTSVRQHAHVAGFYNISGFWDGKLKSKLEEMHKANQNMTISLVPQHDATEQWDGGLLDLLEHIDFLILSEVEAKGISDYNNTSDNTSQSDLLNHIASFFEAYKVNVIVTLGSKGAVHIYNGSIIHQQETTPITSPVDPTGAGDSFAAGFLYGYLSCKTKEDTDKDSNEMIKLGMKYGCAVGTSSIMVQGASIPPERDSIEKILDSVPQLKESKGNAKRQKIS